MTQEVSGTIDGHLGTTRPVAQDTPACIINLLDVSESTGAVLSGQRVIDALVRIINGLLHAIAVKSLDGMDFVNRFYLGLIAFADQAESAVPHLTGGKEPKLLAARDLFPFPLRLERVNDVDQPIFVDKLQPKLNTNLKNALATALALAKKWASEHPDDHAPRVVAVTDGEWTSVGSHAEANELKALTMPLGVATLWIAFVGNGKPVMFPASPDELPPGRFARHMFDLASVLPRQDFERARASGLDVQPGSRALVFNANLDNLPDFLEFASF